MELDIENTEAPEDIEAWSCMSVAEETDALLNGSKDIMLSVSMSEFEHMSISEAKSAQDIVGWGEGGIGKRLVMGVHRVRAGGIYSIGGGGTGGGQVASPPMGVKPRPHRRARVRSKTHVVRISM